MTDLDRYRATVQHTRPDRLLFHLSFTPALEKAVRAAEGLDENADLAQHYGAYRPLSIGLLPPPNFVEPNWSVYFEDMDIPVGAWFDENGCLHIPGSEYHFTRYISPLRHARSLSDIESYPWPTWTTWSTQHFDKDVGTAHAPVSYTHLRAHET
ncbi:MAG: hypothetical protein N2255_08175, partial [Kiritimatiellae bacterium]|nr:hypothetical protein [Kiritimatiellia bacterium]